MSDNLLLFCCGCFASNEDGSWGHTCDENYCYNCGHGPIIQIPRRAVESIRQQASWVGKRYYPHDEDTEIATELQALRALAPLNPHDRAEYEPEGGYYRVYRRDPGKGVVTSIGPVHADSEADALAKANLRLRYVPLEKYEL